MAQLPATMSNQMEALARVDMLRLDYDLTDTQLAIAAMMIAEDMRDEYNRDERWRKFLSKCKPNPDIDPEVLDYLAGHP